MTKPSRVIIMIVLTLIVCLTGCSDEAPQVEEVLRPVRYQVVAADNAQTIRTFSGVSAAAEEAGLSFRVSGAVQNIPVKVGQKINRGDIVAELDSSDLQLKYEEASAAALNSQVQRNSAKSNLTRLRTLYENNNIALSEYEQARNSYSAAKADYAARLKQRDLQKSQLEYSRLLAPMAGVISDVLVSQNENVNAGQVIAVLSSSDDIEINVGVPESYIANIKSGHTVNVTFSASPEITYAGTVSEVGYAASDYSTFPVTITLSGDISSLRPGMAAEVNFPITTQNQGENLVIPSGAVAEDQSGSFAYLLRDSGEAGVAIAERQQIVTGELTQKGFVVKSGLKQGDRVITSGVSKINDGMRVRFDKNMQIQ